MGIDRCRNATFSRDDKESCRRNIRTTSSPAAIILTHGHFDHVGALIELMEYWEPCLCPIKEMPYLTGQENYPEPDYTVEGMVAEHFLDVSE